MRYLKSIKTALLRAAMVSLLATGLIVAGCENSGTAVDSNDSESAPASQPNASVASIGQRGNIEAASSIQSQSGIMYKIIASNARVNRKVTGEVTESLNGVPAEPVHSFVWNGDGSTPIQTAKAILKIDPVSNKGIIRATWQDKHGSWTYRQESYAPPHHPSGLQIGYSANQTKTIVDDPVTTNVYLHGNTGAAEPVLPTIFNLLATWGPGEVTLNGEPFENPYDGPTPLWVGHTMTTVGVRQPDGTVRTSDGGFYNPMKKAMGKTTNDDMEFHLVFHDVPGPEKTNNFPPPLSFFYHLTFEDVSLSIRHSE